MRRTSIFSSCQFSLSLLLPCDSLFLRSKIIVSQSTAAYTSKRKVEQLIILEAVNNNEIVEAVIHDVGGGTSSEDISGQEYTLGCLRR